VSSACSTEVHTPWLTTVVGARKQCCRVTCGISGSCSGQKCMRARPLAGRGARAGARARTAGSEARAHAGASASPARGRGARLVLARAGIGAGDARQLAAVGRREFILGQRRAARGAPPRVVPVPVGAKVAALLGRGRKARTARAWQQEEERCSRCLVTACLHAAVGAKDTQAVAEQADSSYADWDSPDVTHLVDNCWQSPPTSPCSAHQRRTSGKSRRPLWGRCCAGRPWARCCRRLPPRPAHRLRPQARAPPQAALHLCRARPAAHTASLVPQT